MKTIITPPTDEAIKRAGEILKGGGLVAIPTETVYGLAANALDETAVKSIYSAKGRPSDNPLIVHISDFSQWGALVEAIPENALYLAKEYWPGPLTIILRKSALIPTATSGGLETVAVRFPSNETARRVIDAAGVPLAAPSANISGKPSPTKARHVFDDLNGKIEMIIDGGDCEVGVESTVITLAGEKPTLLRPGGVTVKMLEKVLGKIEISPAVLNKLETGEEAASPGMKYRHYSPKAEIVLVQGSFERFRSVLEENDGAVALCFDEDAEMLDGVKSVTIGAEGDFDGQAHRLFDTLRRLDDIGAKKVFARLPKTDGVSLAVYNRLIRSAGFRII